MRTQDEIVYCDGVLFERLIFAQLVKELPVFYAAQRFVAILTNLHHRNVP
jgi:hypothetical protein